MSRKVAAPIHMVRQYSQRLRSRMSSQYAAWLGADVGANCVFWGRPIIRRVEGSFIRIGDRTVLVSDHSQVGLGPNHPTILMTLRAGAGIEIGRDVGITGGTIASAIGISIGDGTLIGANVTIVDTDFHPLAAEDRRYAPLPLPKGCDRVSIGKNVFLGMGAMVLKGAEIGDGTVVGAGSVVAGRLPPRCVAAGNPARPMRELEV